MTSIISKLFFTFIFNHTFRQLYILHIILKHLPTFYYISFKTLFSLDNSYQKAAKENIWSLFQQLTLFNYLFISSHLISFVVFFFKINHTLLLHLEIELNEVKFYKYPVEGKLTSIKCKLNIKKKCERNHIDSSNDKRKARLGVAWAGWPSLCSQMVLCSILWPVVLTRAHDWSCLV